MEVARRLKQGVRSYDVVGRYGGEEFCAVLSNCPERDLRERAEAIRSAIWNDPICFGGRTVKLSVSVGPLSYLQMLGLRWKLSRSPMLHSTEQKTRAAIPPYVAVGAYQTGTL
jgi:diguanylate cyclase (GGDEF)-like protein